MNKTRVSKAYRGSNHIGWKKTVGGRGWFLCYGTSAASEAKGIAIATALEAKWQLEKLSGATALAQSDFDDVRELVEGQPRSTAMSARVHPGQIVPQIVAHIIPPTIAPATAAPSPVPPEQPRHWLYACLDEVIATVKQSLKPDSSNGEPLHVFGQRHGALTR
jgi:hypothetical protein